MIIKVISNYQVYLSGLFLNFELELDCSNLRIFLLQHLDQLLLEILDVIKQGFFPIVPFISATTKFG